MARIEPKFTVNDIRKQLLKAQERFEQAVVLRLSRIGEQFITDARNNNTYKDQTGNLRSSIGYVILKDGRQIGGGFPGSSSEGVQKAETMVRRLLGEDPRLIKGYVLIVVAGMDYAAYVEAKGYDVLTASGIKAGSDLKKAMEKLQK